MSSDQALDSYKKKGIHWNPNLTKRTEIEKSLPYLMISILRIIRVSVVLSVM